MNINLMLSVERELLSNLSYAIAANDMHACVSIGEELRALLDNPEKFECLDGGKCGIGGYCDACPHTKPAAQHQGDPVAWRYKKSWEKTGWKVFEKHPTDYGIDEECYEIQALYAEQPAPVAVVMPSQRAMTNRYIHDQEAVGWNACLAEVARLNGVKP